MTYQIIGDVLLLKEPLLGRSEKKKLAMELMQKMPRIRTVLEIENISGEYRKPKTRKILGGLAITVHKEHELLYKLDASKIMFSKGNLFERKRLVDKVKPCEIVVDMFAGIGYFSLGIAKKAAKVYAIEKNPVAFRYLKENAKLNKLSNLIAVNGDCITVKTEPADRIIMGYFPQTEKFLKSAVSKLKKTGGIIHYHNSYDDKDLWEKPLSQIAQSCRNFKILEKRIVKSVGPRKSHVVIDVEVWKN